MDTLGTLRSELVAWLRRFWKSFTTYSPVSERKRAQYQLLYPVPSYVTPLSNVRPRRIEVQERLTYKTRIGTRVDQDLQKAQGRVLIEIPYDGRRHFPTKAMEALKKEKGHSTEALVGYAGFTAQTRTSYHVGDIGERAIPVKVPIWIPIANAEKAIAQSSLGITRLEYDMPELSSSPVMVDVTLVDDTEIRDFFNLADSPTSFEEHLRLRVRIRSDVGNISQAVKETLLERVDEAAQEAKQRLDEIVKSKPSGMSDEDYEKNKSMTAERHHLFRAIHRRLKNLAEEEARKFTAEEVIHILESEEDRQSPGKEVREDLDDLEDFIKRHLGGIVLSYLGIDWPYAEQVLASQVTNRKWRYNPENGRMETRSRPLAWNDDEHLYETTLYLGMYRPTEPGASLQAHLVLQTDKLLSGSRVRWLDLDENEADVKIEVNTVIDVEIEQMNLREIFSRRFFYPQRRLVFSGVLPSRDRVRDAENILNDVGLTIEERSYGVLSNADPEEGCVVQARLQKIGDPTRIWLMVSGSTWEGTHTVTYDRERQQIQRPIALGDTRVGLYARVAGEDKRINSLFDHIQALLESRFAAFKAI